MNESRKLLESKYFYERMMENLNDNKTKQFSFNLSAFLSSSRSILQYSYKKAEEKDMLNVYQELVSSNEILSFFKDKRNINIHEKPVNPNTKLTVNDTISVSVSVERIKWVKYDKNGNVIEENESFNREENKPKFKKTKRDSNGAKIEYIFGDWEGNEDILTLTKKYIKELEKFISEAKEVGLI